MPNETDNRASSQAIAQYEGVAEMVAKLKAAIDADDDEAAEAAREEIQSDPLSVQVRGGWHNPGDPEAAKPEEFKILLCTGGPAVRIIGELDGYGEPESARLQHQDWFTPWTDADGLPDDSEETLLAYCREFYFGE